MKSQMIGVQAKMGLLMVVATIVCVMSSRTADASEKTKGAAPAAKDDGGSTEDEMAALVRLGPTVHIRKKDAKGRVERLIVVGQGRISTVLGAAKGNEMARKKAALSARAEFVKWLGEKVEVRENAENEATLFLTGAEENDKGAQSEAGKAVEKSSDSYKSVAEGLVRGLTLLHSDVNAEEKTCTLVYGWSAANARAAKHTATNDPSIEDGASGTIAKKSSEGSAASDKKIRSKKATSKEAGDFLK